MIIYGVCGVKDHRIFASRKKRPVKIHTFYLFLMRKFSTRKFKSGKLAPVKIAPRKKTYIIFCTNRRVLNVH